MKKRRNCLGLLWIVILIFLAGCSKEVDLTAYTDETWQVRQTIRYNPDVLPGIGGEVEGLRLNFNTGAMSEEFLQLGLDQLKSALIQKGVQTSWTRQVQNKDSVYQIEMHGAGWQALQDWGLGGDVSSLAANSPFAGTPEEAQYLQAAAEMSGKVEIIPLEGDQVQLTISPPPAQPGSFDFNSLNYGTTFRLHAGQIISSNATRQFLGAATWENPTLIRVVFVPLSKYTPYFAVGGGIGGTLVVGLAWWLIRGLSGARAGVRGPGRPLSGRRTIPPRRKNISRVRRP